MDLYSRSSFPGFADDRDVHRPVVRAHAPQLGRRVVAEHAAGRENRRHLSPVLRGERPDLKHAAIRPHEPPLRDTMRDRIWAETGLGELRAGHDPVLPTGERRDQPIRRQHFVHLAQLTPVKWTFFPYSQHFVHLARRTTVKWTKCSLAHAH